MERLLNLKIEGSKMPSGRYAKSEIESGKFVYHLLLEKCIRLDKLEASYTLHFGHSPVDIVLYHRFQRSFAFEFVAHMIANVVNLNRGCLMSLS